MEKYPEEQERNLPQVIHAIWAGGNRLLPKEGFINLANWAYLNPGFKIVLWVDGRVLPTDLKLIDLQELYIKKFTEAYLKYAKEEVLDKDITSIIEIKSIREAGICADANDLVDYAIDRLDPNYGLSSDLLRYRILYKYGGFYIDPTDVVPGDQKLNILKSIPYANFDKVNEEHKLFVDHLSQTKNPPKSDLKIFKISAHDFEKHSEEENERFLVLTRVGNDSFICTKGNPLMLLMAREAERRLQCITLNEKIMMAYGGFNKKDLTLDLSGPNIVKTIIYNSQTGLPKQNTDLKTTGYFKKPIGTAGSYIFALRTEQHQTVKPPENVRNTRYWNNVSLNLSRNNTIEDVIQKIVELASHEINQMGVLRLDDHINTLTQAALLLEVSREEISTHYDSLLSKIKKLPLGKVDVAQCISTNPSITEFYEQNDLMSKIVLNTTNKDQLSSLLKIWEQCTSFGLLMGTKDFEMEKLLNIKTEEIETTLNPIEIQDICQRMERGVKFISHIKQNLESYPCYRDLLLLEKFQGFQKQYLQDVIIKYGIVLDAYSEAFLKADISPKELNQLGRQLVELAKIDMLPKKLQQLVKIYQAEDINHALRIAASKGNLNDVKYLAKYADINGQGGKSKRTALHQAAEKGHKDIMECLIEYGVSVNLKDKDDKTAYELIAQSSIAGKK